jgi:hypothetical protein
MKIAFDCPQSVGIKLMQEVIDGALQALRLWADEDVAGELRAADSCGDV